VEVEWTIDPLKHAKIPRLFGGFFLQQKHEMPVYPRKEIIFERMRRCLAVFLILFVTSCAHAQMVDSLRLYFKKSPMVTGGWGAVQSFVYGFKAPVGYATLGVSFGGRVRLGMGYCKLKVPDYKSDLSTGQEPFYKNLVIPGPDVLAPSRLRYSYFMVYGEYVFYKNKRWTFSVPLRFGFGHTQYHYQYNELSGVTDRHFMFVYNPSISFDYTIFRWLGFNTEFGYKFTLSGHRSIRQNFNSPVYNLGFFLYYSEIYKMLFPNTKLAKML
jgi:hypothetical protein